MAQAARKYDREVQTRVTPNNQVSPLELQKQKYKRRERLVFGAAMAWTTILGCFTIASSTSVNIAQNKLQNITTEISSLTSKNSNIKQEVSELSSRARLSGIAKKDNLSLNEQNTRNVTK